MGVLRFDAGGLDKCTGEGRCKDYGVLGELICADGTGYAVAESVWM